LNFVVGIQKSIYFLFSNHKILLKIVTFFNEKIQIYIATPRLTKPKLEDACDYN